MRRGTLIERRYRLGAKLAASGMSQVYRAHDEMLGAEVAVKLLHPILHDEAHQRERFSREVSTMGALEHPNIVRVTDSGTSADGTPYMVQEFVDGPMLHESFGGLSVAPEVYLPIVVQIASALQYCHERGIVHRDLKPANIFVLGAGEPNPRVKIADFGIASMLEEPGITQNGMLAGTPGYMAPEYIRGELVSEQVDIYSLGVILYELATGSHPFPDTSAEELIRAHAEILPDSPRESRPSLDLGLTQFILRCLHKKPSERPWGASGFLAEVYEIDPSLRT